MSTFVIHTQLTLEDIHDILRNKKYVLLSDEAKQRVVSCRAYLEKKIEASDGIYYGINTGFGALCNTRISSEDIQQLQYNLLRSHACGTGMTVDPQLVKIMLLLKVQSLALGYSGVKLETVERLLWFFNTDILPVVYEQGSLGASGDLAPLAHLALPLFGEGNVWVKENNSYIQKSAAEVHTLHNKQSLTPESKEGLALINGTQFMLAYAVWCTWNAQYIIKQANEIAALSTDAFECKPDPFMPQLHQIRNQHGQIEIAKQIQNLLDGSNLFNKSKQHVQDPYAFRCIPQVHGASLDTIHFVKQIVEREMAAVTDNPNVFAEEDMILSGGNFHGQPLALVLDFLAIALAEIGSISERRTYQLISGQRGLPPFLTPNPGLHSGLMIPQYTAASMVSQNKQLCTPASVDSIVSSNGQEDHVSMGANAATKCKRVVENVQMILAIEWLNATQALEFRRPFTTSPYLEERITAYRSQVSFIQEDRYLHTDIKHTFNFLFSGLFGPQISE